ncbi:vacuolar protein sorting-associated protein 54-like [Biomphalaria glabrata]|uniref:Vacuolar protein sorting-associated protein 54 n=1 Tax=Biomphalaria glabrata TaxID=6526 RepID=A0A9W2ZTU7_BIOGL|nr:vacuolar protein sorting-associated protein 54-like [Biomphalaria glabrata]XP_055878406.1 vacuolar protein sorting-associated protein 54-like [Biomphalaria glabrata]
MSLTALQSQVTHQYIPWKKCSLCRDANVFKSPRDFSQHLRDFHCSKEGGSYVCRYGMNGVCPSLPLEGVSDRDYDDHVIKDHIHTEHGGARSKIRSIRSEERQCSEGQATTNSDPCIVQDQFKWTIHNATVNLPALLNDPRLVKRETDFFTKTWGQSFEKAEILPSPYVPEIGLKHFEKYLRKTSVRLKKHSKNRDKLTEAPTGGKDIFPSLHFKQLEQGRADYDQIKLFMSTQFNLENPEIFNAVFPWSQIEESKSTQQTDKRQSTKLLQEKLSHYLDSVEVQIARQISQKSEAFFHAMTSHDELQENLAHTIQCIKQLREYINILNEKIAKESLKVIKLSRTKANYQALYNKLKIMSSIHETQPTIQRLLSNNEFIGSLDLISTSQDVLCKDLAGIHSFRHLGSQLAEMEKLIDKMLQADFNRCISMELNRPVKDALLLADEEHLVSVLFGMLRQHKFNFIDVYREEAFTALKATVKQTVVEAVAIADCNDTENNASSLADQMRLLNYPQWMELLKQVFASVMVLLDRTKAFHGLVTNIMGMAAGKNKACSDAAMAASGEDVGETEYLHVSLSEDVDVMITSAEYDKAQVCLREMLYAVSDYGHDRCVKVMNARAKDGFLDRLSSSEFVILSRCIEDFVSDTEQVCGRKSMSLRGVLQNQANKFVARFHEERKNKLSLILDNERWRQADVPAEFQDLVSHVINTGTLTLPEKKSGTGSTQITKQYLYAGEEEFAVVGTVLMLVKMMVEYCQCVVDIPSATPDLLTRLIDLLKMFNSRTCQLLIGAGARQLVGLKTISTKNLALASRCLQLVVFFIPQVKEHFEQTLPAKNSNMLKNFKKITKDYDDHIEEINLKLISISENMTESQLTKYEVKAPMPSQCFRTICKQLAKLHEALVGTLPLSQIRELFQRINQSFMHLLGKRLAALKVTNDGGPQCGLVISDLTFYSGSFNTLKGLENLVTSTNAVWDVR